MSCASIGHPEGEPKDEIPPKILKETPENYSKNFNSNIIKIDFDELIVTKNIRKELIISPPFKEFPKIRPTSVANKTLTIEFEDTLKDNTTYTLNFGNSIQDFNEGNPLKQYKYIFSTGNYIDSLKITAKVRDALSNTLEKDIFLLLYKIDSLLSDSTIIVNKNPSYISNFLDSNFASINNIKEGRYILIALKDNGNLKYDIKTDKIAFLDSIITLNSPDSLYHYNLKLFKAVPSFKFLRAANTENGVISFFSEGQDSSFKIKKIFPTNDILNNLLIDNKFENNYKIDSIIEFFTTSDHNDTIIFNFNYVIDSLSFLIYHKDIIIDTFSIKPKFKKNKEEFKLTTNKVGNIDLNEKLIAYTNYPIKKIKKDSIVILDKDSNIIDYKIILDSNTLKKIILDFNIEAEKVYIITFLPECLTSIFYDTISDTTKIFLNTKKSSNYGNLKLKLSTNLNKNEQLIIEIIDTKEQVIQKQIIQSSQGEIDFKNLLPSTIFIRITLDKNKNGQWDSGNFFKKLQPEIVKYSEKIDIKAFWDIEQEWEINFNQ